MGAQRRPTRVSGRSACSAQNRLTSSCRELIPRSSRRALRRAWSHDPRKLGCPNGAPHVAGVRGVLDEAPQVTLPGAAGAAPTCSVACVVAHPSRLVSARNRSNGSGTGLDSPTPSPSPDRGRRPRRYGAVTPAPASGGPGFWACPPHRWRLCAAGRVQAGGHLEGQRGASRRELCGTGAAIFLTCGRRLSLKTGGSYLISWLCPGLDRDPILLVPSSHAPGG